MSSRFTPSGESRYTPRDRDRSPSRFERRGSSSSGPVRNSDNSYRPGDSTSNSRDISGVPRGPSGRGGGSYVSRGRGYGGRDSRDGRDGQFHRRDNDREFSRRDSDRRSPPSRNRSRTPPSTRDFRDARDNRDAQLRSLDMTRVTRESRDGGPLSAASASSEANSSSSAFHRGGFRNRGRGDWDRASSRRNFDDRDSFRTRSRSRDRWDRDRDRDRDYDRDSRREDDVRDRDNDRGRREPPLRPDSRDSVISQPTSATGAAGSDRRDAPKPPTFSNEASRRSSFAQPTGRPDFVRGQSSTQPPSSPIHYPQVPEFGAIKTSNVSSDAPRSITLSNLKDEPTIGLKNESADPTKLAPRGPKADLVTQQPPVAPKAFPRRTLFPDPSTTSRRFDDSPIVVTPSNPRFGPSSSPSFPQTTNNRPRNPTWSGPELMTRPTPGSATSQEIRNLNDHDTSTRPADIRIPTGPKGSRDQSVRTPLSARSNKSATISWINPNRPQPSAQHKPSIMQSMHHRKDDEYLSRASANSPSRDLRNEIRSSATGDNVGTRISSNNVTSARRLTLSPSTGPNTMAESRDNGLEEEDDEDAMEEEEEGEEDDEEEAEEEEEDDDDDEDDAELDQQDFERHEARFKKQIESLQSKLVLSPSLNPKILTALETIEIYASAIEDYKNGYIPPTKATEKARPRTATTLSPTLSTRPATMPTPPAELVQIKTEESKIDMKDIIMMDLSLEGLTYLDKDPLTPASFEFSGSEADELDLCDRIRKKLALDQNEDEQLQEKYKESYLQWREEVDKIDEEITQQESIPTRAATPVSAIGTETAGTPVPESGRRSTRNATEMDLERVIKESAEEAQAAEMAQVPIDMSVDADMTREAIIPEMLTEEDQTMFVFEDVNNRIPNSSDIMTIGAPEDTPVFKAYDYLPAEDDFNPEDQERFKDAYAKFPKQWGFIANNMNEAVLSIQTSDGKLNLPKNRDYHQCIFHYYMTKKQAKPAYKLLPNRKARAKKKTSSGVRRANQRSSMLGNGEDGSVRMSDTGRPKRAAAPNFNDKEKREAEALAQKAAAKERKASTLLNKPTGDGSAVPEKQPIRRVRKREGEKTTKRSTKATTALAPNVSPGRNGERGTSVDVQMQDAYGSRDLEGAQLLAQLQGYTGVTQTPQKQPSTFSGGSQNETWRIDPRILAPNQNLQLPSGPAQTSGMSVLDTGSSQHGTIPLAQTGTFSTRQLSPGLVNLQGGPASQASTSGGSSRSQGSTSSYWSVQEQTQFIELVKIYGRDWSMIGKFLPLKTETMVCLLLGH